MPPSSPANWASYKLTVLALGYKITAAFLDGLASRGPPARRRRAAGAEVMRFIAGRAVRSAGEHGVVPVEGALVEHGDCALVAVLAPAFGRGDYGLPVWPPVQALLAQGGALARAVERDDVVAAPQRACGQRQVVLLQRGVVPAVVDQGRARDAGVIDQVHVAGQRGVLVRDADGAGSSRR